MFGSVFHSRSLARTLAACRRNAPAVPLAVAIGIGQALVWWVGDLGLACLISLFGTGLCLRTSRALSWFYGGMILGILTALCARIDPGIPPQSSGEVSILGTVSGSPRHPRPGEVVFELKTNSDTQRGLVRFRAVDLPWRNSAHLQPGDTVQVRGQCLAVNQPQNPFSWKGWLWRRGVIAQCKARFVSAPLSRTASPLHRVRELVRARVIDTLGDSQGVGLFLSMALGYQDLLSVPLEKSFTRLGLTHLLVVSGYQVSLMFGFVLSCGAACSARARLGGRYLRISLTAVAFGFAALYVLFIGSEMSAVRALLAAGCICAHFLSDRETSFAQRWGIALLGMQLLWPWCVFDVGVILTFAALFGIGVGSEFAPQSRWIMFVAVTVTVWLCTSIVIVLWQGMLSPVGLLLNLVIAAPWSILNCTAGLLSLLILLSGIPLCSYPLLVITWVNQRVSDAILALGESPYSGWQVVGGARLVLASMLIAIVLGLVGRNARVRRVSLR